MEFNVQVFADIGRRLGEEMQGPREGVVDGQAIGIIRADEKDVPIVAVPDYPLEGGAFVVGGREAGEEEIGTTDGRGEVRVGAQAEWAKSRGVGMEYAEEYAEEWGAVELAEAAAEGGG
jgi:hypothetical protein